MIPATLAVLVLALTGMVVSAAALLPVPVIVPQVLFGIAMVLALLHVIGESDEKRL